MVLILSEESISLNTPINEEESTMLIELIADNDTDTPEEKYMNKSKIDELYSALETLTPREQFVIRERFGLNSGRPPKTLETVGSEMKVTRERVRQIEAKALRKLRRSKILIPKS